MKFTGERFVPELRGQIAYEHRHRYVVALEFAMDRDVLDIACGEGYGASLLATSARSVTGVDIDESSIRHAASRYPAMNLAFRAGSATAIPLADDAVDLVVSFETLEHLTEQRAMLAEFVRVLRADGRVVISSPNKLVYSDARGYSNEFHVRELYFDEFRDLLGEFFPRVRLFGQRITGSSVIHPLHGSSPAGPWLDPFGHRTGIVALPDPEYFIAVCGLRADDDLADIASVFVDGADDLLHDVRGGGLAAASNGVASHGEGSHASAAVENRNGHTSDEFRARLGAAMVDLELAAARVAELEFERDEARVELGLTLTERDLARRRIVELEEAAGELDLAAARIAELHEERERLARAEFERAETAGAVRDELRSLTERVAAIERERDDALSDADAYAAQLDVAEARIRELEAERSRQSAAYVQAHAERGTLRAEITALVAELESAVTRAAQSARHRDSAVIARDAALRARDADAARIVGLERRALAMSALLEETAGLQRRSDVAARRAEAMLFDARAEAGRHRGARLHLEVQVAALLAALGRSSAVVSSLGGALTHAGEALATLEASRLRLEFDLTTRATALATKVVRGATNAARLRAELSLLHETLQLRERRLAVLETVLTGIAEENRRATERARARYGAMLANLRASKFWKLRAAVRKVLGRPAE